MLFVACQFGVVDMASNVHLTLYNILFPAGVVAAQCWRNITCTRPKDTAFPGVWHSNIYAPASRVVSPKNVLSPSGDFQSAYPTASVLSGNASQIVFDFGKEVGGIITIDYSATGPGQLGLAFTEAKNWIGEWSDSSNGAFEGPDGAIYASLTPEMPAIQRQKIVCEEVSDT